MILIQVYLASSPYDQFRPSFISTQQSGYPHIPAFEIHIRIPVVSSGLVTRDDHCKIMVGVISAEIQVVFVGGPGIIDFMDPAVYIPNFPDMVVGMVCWNRYDPVSDGIIPVPEFRIHTPVIMVHTIGPGNMDPVRYPVVVIYCTVPDGIVMIAFNMICTYSPPIGSFILLAMLGMCPCSILPLACIAPDRLIISMAVGITADITIVTGGLFSIVSANCTLVRGRLLSLICTSIAPVRGSVSTGTTLITSIATGYLALPRLFVGAFLCLAPADTGTVTGIAFGRTCPGGLPAPVSMGDVPCTGLPGSCGSVTSGAFLFSRPSNGRFTLLFLRFRPASFP